MAELRVHGKDTVLTDGAQIDAFLKNYGIDYEYWDISKLADAGVEDSDKEGILAVFDDEITTLKERGGYLSADVISLVPETPNLDAMLSKFDKEHLHTEDEVRFVVDGRGVFTIHGEDDVVFDVEVHAGDLLVVPANTWHWFNLCEDRTIKCIRVFESTGGWAPHYRAEGAAQ